MAPIEAEAHLTDNGGESFKIRAIKIFAGALRGLHCATKHRHQNHIVPHMVLWAKVFVPCFLYNKPLPMTLLPNLIDIASNTAWKADC